MAGYTIPCLSGGTKRAGRLASSNDLGDLPTDPPQLVRDSGVGHRDVPASDHPYGCRIFTSMDSLGVGLSDCPSVVPVSIAA